MPTAYIGLGSNLGDRRGNLAAALRELSAAPGARVIAVSHVYESEPWGIAGQPAFANAVAEVSWAGDAEALLEACKDVESRLGRVAAPRFGPRVIDLDVLLFGDRSLRTPRLTVPHPRLAERDFVVTPLLELAPDVRLPDGTRPDASRAVAGRVTGVLGPVPGFEDLTPDER